MTGQAKEENLTTSTKQQEPTLVIVPTQGWVSLKLPELWQYRDLLLMLAWREISVRYKQTVLGALWAIIQPVVAMLIFSMVFGRLAKMPSQGLPYPLFSYVAMLPWQYFSAVLSNSSNSLLNNPYLLSKNYCPRLIIPVAAALPPAVDFCFAFLVLLVMLAYYGVVPDWKLILLPVFLFLALLASVGLGLWLSALTVEYRDVRFVLPFLVQCWLYASPVVYPSTLIPEQWLFVYGLNPMAGVIEGFRWAVLGVGQPVIIWTSTMSASVLIITGALFFRRMERTFGDRI